MRNFILASLLSAAIGLTACDSKPASTTPPAKSGSGSPAAAKNDSHGAKAGEKDNHEHKPGEKDDHDHKEGDGHDHSKGGDSHGGSGPSIELGTSDADGMKVKAARDGGDIKPGGDLALDVWIDGGLGNASAVRFWIGSADAKGSVKAKAEVEDGKWHSHVEVPGSLPAGSKVWVEIEAKGGKKSVLSFDLK